MPTKKSTPIKPNEASRQDSPDRSIVDEADDNQEIKPAETNPIERRLRLRNNTDKMNKETSKEKSGATSDNPQERVDAADHQTLGHKHEMPSAIMPDGFPDDSNT